MKRLARRFTSVGTVILATLVTVAVAAPLLAPYDPTERSGIPFARPSGAHLLGTNDAGQDLLSELIYGSRISLLVGVVAALAATMIGTSVGIVAGYSRGWLDNVLMRLVDVVLTLPVLPLTIVIGVFAGPGLSTQIVVIAAVIWAGMARELRAQVLSIRERDHIQALRAMGARTGYVVRRHVLPAVGPLVVPQFVMAVTTAVLLEASLAFLGLGDISAKSWGTMLSLAHARSAFLTDAWLWWVLPPGLAIAATVLAFALIGYALEERTRPALGGGVRRAHRRPGRAVRRPASTASIVVVADEAPLVIERLRVHYGSEVLAVDQVSLTVAAGELVALVGESGSGKSTVAAAAVGLLPAAATARSGCVRVCGRDLSSLSATELRALRGDRVALIPQEAMSALDPVHSIGDQLAEAVRAHRRVGRSPAHRRASELLELVGLDPTRAGDYPHQLSGGMSQRVVIAMAIANDPEVVIADEPTSGLDVIRQAEVLDLLQQLRVRLNLALLVVSHDLPMIERIADRIAVMHHGRLVEVGPTATIIAAPTHPHTQRLIEAAPRLRLPIPTVVA
ncbi:MAG: dipeptide/oligopeptide/nickel ABC transporter permease/ATP-binding protein [Actinomycetota bacterium]|nr:dipeptide/oligopeptide/nickel ABC transporter permease/ATP-binding protein [Actinomycetota bacterium]